jgi:hypothetical protein
VRAVEPGSVHPFPPPPPGAERRVHPRQDLFAQVELSWGDSIVIAMVNNLSLGGAFLLHDGDDVAVGEEVVVQLSTEDVAVAQLAKVVRVSTSEPRGFAVSWIEPRARTYAIIERLMRAEAAAPPRVMPPPVKPARAAAKKRKKSADVARP